MKTWAKPENGWPSMRCADTTQNQALIGSSSASATTVRRCSGIKPGTKGIRLGRAMADDAAP